VPEPMWRQIAEDLRQKIDSGELGFGGQPLPTELELQANYNASRNTVRDAIKWLVSRGLVYTRSGQGTFVRAKIDPFVTALRAEVQLESESRAFASQVEAGSRAPEVSVPRVEVQLATEVSARELQLAEHTSVISRHQRRLIDGVPYSLQTTFYPMDLVDQGATRLLRAEDIVEGAVRYVEQVLGIKQAGRRDTIMVRVPDANEAIFFGIPDDGSVPVLEIIRTGFDEHGWPFRVTVTTMPADRNRLVMIVGEVPGAPPDLTAPPVPEGDEPVRNKSQGRQE
jgi:GntR family transcriptional regulator